jgi:antitoxin CptB
MLDQLDTRRRRAAFRATHRGTKEMDWMLGKYADNRLAAMADPELDLFEKLIQLPDPDLQAWILDPALISQSAFAPLIADLRAFHKLDAPVA